jgi:hypothetical protein
MPASAASAKPVTVDQYLASLPADRRQAISAIRAVILKNLDADFEEGMQYGMIGYHVPHRIYPQGYHCEPSKPLPFVMLGSGKKLEMGKACMRFKKLDDVPLSVVGEAIRKVPAA